MSKLKLGGIQKTYRNGEIVHALKGISLEFRKNEFVSVLGPSGCGKTTLLNIIGGLDRYDNGDLIIGGMYTHNFKDADWDAYRNRSIGFVFQNYNLISHQTVLQNVEIALTLSGVSASERRHRAKQALADVGLSDQENKKPSQMSGGQMQRVAIARALVNNPEIILADEPTGSLDSHTSVQIMEILKEISKTRLVIMVTHNGELAEFYSTRIVRLLDGELQSDSNPLSGEEAEAEPKSSDLSRFAKTSMSLASAMALSLKNLLTKKGRTVTTAIAGSIGIIGLGLVLALTGGVNSYIDNFMTDTMTHFPVMVPRSLPASMLEGNNQDIIEYIAFPDSDDIHRFADAAQESYYNPFTEDYFAHVRNIETALPGAVNDISYRREMTMNIISNAGNTVVKFDTGAEMDLPAFVPGMDGSQWQEMPDNQDFIMSIYDLLAGRMPESKNEILLVVDEFNRLDESIFENLGVSKEHQTFTVNSFLGQTILKLVDNNDYYQQISDIFVPANPSQYDNLFRNAGGVELTIVGVLRVQENALGSFFFFSEGFLYTSALTEYFIEQAAASDIVTAQKDSDINVFTGVVFVDEDERDIVFSEIGANTAPTSINIFPVDNISKMQIREYLDSYNVGLPVDARILNTDMAEIFAPTVGTMFDILPALLGGFAFISLIVSTIMIGLITYVSVMERTKEIGILRSVGARKKDISRVFTAETMIIGLAAGTLGVIMAFVLTIPLNMLFENLAGISGLVGLNPLYALLLIGGSMLLTMIAGFFPSRAAAKKDPVEALRTE